MNALVKLPHFEGWHLIDAFPDNEPDDVGSWLLVNRGEALLLEVPPGLRADHARRVLGLTGAVLRYFTASHNHCDHLDGLAWGSLMRAFPEAEIIHPSSVRGDRRMSIGGEPLWLVGAPKHSATDVVTIFRGVAMTGDIELEMLESVNNEVPLRVKRKSMKHLQGFEERTGYHVHSIVSAHLNDVRQGITWSDLFETDPHNRCPRN